MSNLTDSRREFVKRAAYVAPAVLTLMATPSFAKSGSHKPDIWDGPRKPKPGKPKPGKPPKLGKPPIGKIPKHVKNKF